MHFHSRQIKAVMGKDYKKRRQPAGIYYYLK